MGPIQKPKITKNTFKFKDLFVVVYATTPCLVWSQYDR